MSTKLRKPIACIRVQRCEEHKSDHPPADDAVRAVCGICRSDVWISPEASARFTQAPDDHVLACMECAVETWKKVLETMPDLRLGIGEEQIGFEIKSTSGDPGDYPPWGFSTELRPMVVAIEVSDEDEDDDDL